MRGCEGGGPPKRQSLRGSSYRTRGERKGPWRAQRRRRRRLGRPASGCGGSRLRLTRAACNCGGKGIKRAAGLLLLLLLLLRQDLMLIWAWGLLLLLRLLLGQGGRSAGMREFVPSYADRHPLQGAPVRLGRLCRVDATVERDSRMALRGVEARDAHSPVGSEVRLERLEARVWGQVLHEDGVRGWGVGGGPGRLGCAKGWHACVRQQLLLLLLLLRKWRRLEPGRRWTAAKSRRGCSRAASGARRAAKKRMAGGGSPDRRWRLCPKRRRRLRGTEGLRLWRLPRPPRGRLDKGTESLAESLMRRRCLTWPSRCRPGHCTATCGRCSRKCSQLSRTSCGGRGLAKPSKEPRDDVGKRLHSCSQSRRPAMAAPVVRRYM